MITALAVTGAHPNGDAVIVVAFWVVVIVVAVLVKLGKSS